MMIDENIRKQNTHSVLVGIGIASIVMLFAGLTSAYIVRMKEGNWTEFALPFPFTISTIIILLSSLTMQLAVVAVRKNQFAMLKTMLILTLTLGLLFVFFQFSGWTEMIKQKLFLVANDPSTSFVYIITGLHLAHLAGGIIALVVVSIKSILEKYDSVNKSGVIQCSLYWHFLGALWLYLFFFFKYVR